MTAEAGPPLPPLRCRPDWPFFAGLAVLSGVYVLFIVAMLAADLSFTSPRHLLRALASPEIRYAIKLSLISCSLTTLLSLWIAVPTGYLLSRHRFPGKRLMDAILDIPIVLPPLVIGLSLLILFQTPPGRALQQLVPVTYAIPSVILAQFAVACAFAVRTMLVTFDQISPRCEQVALTLGCNRSQAFWRVALPEARRGLLTAATLAWARALGEFGATIMFAGSLSGRTQTMPLLVYSVFERSVDAAVWTGVLLLGVALVALLLSQWLASGEDRPE